MTKDVHVTAVILTYNEEVHLRRCLERLDGLADRLVIVDSYSTDATEAIAREYGADFLQNKFINHAAQFAWGLEAARVNSGWVLRIDCDEYFEPAAVTGVRARLAVLPPTVSALSFRRKVFFRGRWIRWGGYYNTVLTRLWRAGTAHVEQRWMDEHVVVTHGETLLWKQGDLVDDNLKDITWWTDKHNGYTTRQMVESINQEYRLFGESGDNHAQLNSAARWKRYLRNGIFARTPLYLRSLLYFVQRYFLRLGFLDGREGLVFHFLQGCWNFFLVDAKVDEARRYIETHGLNAFRDHLAARHGIVLKEPAASG